MVNAQRRMRNAQAQSRALSIESRALCIDYAAGSAALACAATLANAAGCVTAMSASILRSSVMPAALRPRISCE